MLTHQGAPRQEISTDTGVDPYITEIGRRKIGQFGVNCCLMDANDVRAAEVMSSIQQSRSPDGETEEIAIALITANNLLSLATELGCPVIKSGRVIPDGFNRETTWLDFGQIPVSLFVPRPE